MEMVKGRCKCIFHTQQQPQHATCLSVSGSPKKGCAWGPARSQSVPEVCYSQMKSFVIEGGQPERVWVSAAWDFPLAPFSDQPFRGRTPPLSCDLPSKVVLQSKKKSSDFSSKQRSDPRSSGCAWGMSGERCLEEELVAKPTMLMCLEEQITGLWESFKGYSDYILLYVSSPGNLPST